ncbi:hypothetical protein D3C72_755290 [compost metagenome]
MGLHGRLGADGGQHVVAALRLRVEANPEAHGVARGLVAGLRQVVREVRNARIGEVVEAVEAHLRVQAVAVAGALVDEVVGVVDVLQLDDDVALLEVLAGVVVVLGVDELEVLGGDGRVVGHRGAVEVVVVGPDADPLVLGREALEVLVIDRPEEEVVAAVVAQIGRVPGVVLEAAMRVLHGLDRVLVHVQHVDLDVPFGIAVVVPALDAALEVTQHDLGRAVGIRRLGEHRRGARAGVGHVGVHAQLDRLVGAVIVGGVAGDFQPAGVGDEARMGARGDRRRVRHVDAEAAPEGGGAVRKRHAGGVRVVAQRHERHELGVEVDHDGVFQLARGHPFHQHAQAGLGKRSARGLGRGVGGGVLGLLLGPAHGVVELVGEAIVDLAGVVVVHRGAVDDGVLVDAVHAHLAFEHVGVVAHVVGAELAGVEVDPIQRHRAGVVRGAGLVADGLVVRVTAVGQPAHPVGAHFQAGVVALEQIDRARDDVAQRVGVGPDADRVLDVDEVHVVDLRRLGLRRLGLDDVGHEGHRRGAGDDAGRALAVALEDGDGDAAGALLVAEGLHADLADELVGAAAHVDVAGERHLGVGDLGVDRHDEGVVVVALRQRVDALLGLGAGGDLVGQHLLHHLHGLLNGEGAVLFLRAHLERHGLEHGHAEQHRGENRRGQQHFDQRHAFSHHGFAPQFTVRWAERRSRY